MDSVGLWDGIATTEPTGEDALQARRRAPRTTMQRSTLRGLLDWEERWRTNFG